MQLFIDAQDGKRLHHAYLIEGPREGVVAALRAFLEKHFNISTHANPDFWYGIFDSFGIDDGRALKEAHSRKAFSEGKKFFIVAANTITHEAQNALLKMLEDPTPHTHFFIVMPTSAALLPTFLSRVALFEFAEEKKQIHALVSPFLSSSPVERMKLLKPIIENKDKREALEFVNSLEEVLRKKGTLSSTETFLFEEILKCRGYLLGRSPSVKMILEYLSLAVPTLS